MSHSHHQHMDHSNHQMDHSQHNNMDHSNHHMTTEKASNHAHHDHGKHPVYDVVTHVMTTVMSHLNHAGNHNHVAHETHGAHDHHDMHSMHEMSDGGMNHDMHAGHGTGHGHASHGAGHGGHASHSGHHPAFFSDAFDRAVLFEEWTVDTKTSIFLVILLTIILSIGYQGIKWVRKYLHTNYRDRIHSMKSKEHLMQTLLYGTEFFISYILMLVVMTYNTWVLVVTVLGLGLGYFLFGLHQARQKCDVECQNICSTASPAKNYDKNPSAQELIPLENETDCCQAGCPNSANGIQDIKETDILT